MGRPAGSPLPCCPPGATCRRYLRSTGSTRAQLAAGRTPGSRPAGAASSRSCAGGYGPSGAPVAPRPAAPWRTPPDSILRGRRRVVGTEDRPGHLAPATRQSGLLPCDEELVERLGQLLRHIEDPAVAALRCTEAALRNGPRHPDFPAPPSRRCPGAECPSGPGSAVALGRGGRRFLPSRPRWWCSP